MKISSFFYPAAPGLFTTIKKEKPPSDACKISASSATSQEKARTTSRLIETKHINLEKEETANKLLSGCPVTGSRKDDSHIKPKESSMVLQKTLPLSSLEDGVGSLDTSNDSDLEIIESTPEVKKCNKANILSSKITCSPDIIPSTPQAQPNIRICNFSLGSKSTLSDGYERTSSSSLSSSKALTFSESNVIKRRPLSLKSKVNSSRLNKHIKEKTKISVTNWQDIHVSTKGENHSVNQSLASTKRHAVSRIGVSPDSKRVNMTDSKVFEKVVENCKSNLLERFVGGVTIVSDGESDGSFSLLQPNIGIEEKEKLMNRENCEESLKEQQHILVKEEVPITRSYENTDPFHNTGKASLKEQTSPFQSYEAEGTESELDIENSKIKHTQKLKNVSGSLKNNGFPLQEFFSSSQGFGSIGDSLDQEFEVEEISSTSDMKDVFDDTIDDILDDDLAATFEIMSPFKQEVKGQKQSDVENK